MDLATIIGIVLSVLVVLVTLLAQGDFGTYINIPSILIVVGGTIAVTLIRFPADQLKRTMAALKYALRDRVHDHSNDIDELVHLARKARREGLLTLEDYASEDPFLLKAIELAVDGSDIETVESILSREIYFLSKRHREIHDILYSIGDVAPAFGMIGTLVGLIAMLSNMQDMQSLGPAMAVAIITTLYGAVIANLFALPFAKKLELRSEDEQIHRELVLEGIVLIIKGENHRLVETALCAFLAKREQAGEADPSEVKAA